MPAVGLGAGGEFLLRAATGFFSQLYQRPVISTSAELDQRLRWKPSLYFTLHDHLVVCGEVSETPYPMILRLRRADILNLPVPIAIYSVCPEEAYLLGQADAKELIAHGFGLLTVSASGEVQRRAACIPLVQQISDEEFRSEISPLPLGLRRRLAEIFEHYKQNAPSGVSEVTEIMEGMILRAAKDTVRKGWIKSSAIKGATVSSLLSTLSAAAQCRNAVAAIGSAQGYVSEYRNPAHHFPRSRRQAHKKYRDCRHGFLDGVKKLIMFRAAMRSIGLTGSL